MKYTAINEMSHFTFHDANIHKIYYNGPHLVWELSALNATIENSQNCTQKDMCIKYAVITFENVNIESIIFTGYKVYDANNTLIKSIESKPAKPDDYAHILITSPDDYCYIFSIEELPATEDEKFRVCFDINYKLTFSFSKSIIQWDEYCGIAWYEDPKFKNLNYCRASRFFPTREYETFSRIVSKAEIISYDCGLCGINSCLNFEAAELEYIMQVPLDLNQQILVIFKNPFYSYECRILKSLEFCGYDICESGTSAITNCGGIFDKAIPYHNLNKYGLINDYNETMKVRKLLIELYPNECHANCDIYELWRRL